MCGTKNVYVAAMHHLCVHAKYSCAQSNLCWLYVRYSLLWSLRWLGGLARACMLLGWSSEAPATSGRQAPRVRRCGSDQGGAGRRRHALGSCLTHGHARLAWHVPPPIYPQRLAYLAPAESAAAGPGAVRCGATLFCARLRVAEIRHLQSMSRKHCTLSIRMMACTYAWVISNCCCFLPWLCVRWSAPRTYVHCHLLAHASPARRTHTALVALGRCCPLFSAAQSVIAGSVCCYLAPHSHPLKFLCALLPPAQQRVVVVVVPSAGGCNLVLLSLAGPHPPPPRLQACVLVVTLEIYL